MNKIETGLSGIYVLKYDLFQDSRGKLFKPFNEKMFSEHGLVTSFKETLSSESIMHVLRGMHYEVPFKQRKLVWVSRGHVLDVVVCVNKDSPDYGKFFSIHLKEFDGQCLYISPGYAHGFLTLSSSAVFTYMTSTNYVPGNDNTVRWDSFGFDWPSGPKVISDKDINALPLETK